MLDALSEKTRGRDITGWNVWDKVYSGDVFVGIGSEPTVYGDDAVFTAEQLSDKIIDPIYAEEDIRNFVVLDQIGAIDILSENLFYWVNFADEYARRIKHNFTGNGAFDLEEMVLSGV